jgi:hypothetical protein
VSSDDSILDEKPGIKAKVVAETKLMAVNAAYLAVFLVAFTTYRRLVLAEYKIGYFHYGYSLVEALVLAKIIAIGRLLHLGERFRSCRLIVPTLYKAFCFSILFLAFSIIERLCDGLLHHEDLATIQSQLIHNDLWEILARTVIVCTAMVPLIAFEQADALVGQGRLFELFFKRPQGRGEEIG